MTNGRLLLVLDDSPASRRAVAYAARMVGGQRQLRFYLAHPLAPLPTGLLEFRGASNPYEEERLDARLKERQNRWTSKAQDAAQQVFARAEATLRRGDAAQSRCSAERRQGRILRSRRRTQDG